MAAVAGLLDLNEPMFGLSKVEVVQSIDPTKLQVSPDDCDLLCMGWAQRHLPDRLARPSPGCACVRHCVPAPSSIKVMPCHHLSGNMQAIGAPWQEPACSRAGAAHAGNPEVDYR